MKLLIYSHFFAPSIGGVESAVMSLADGLPSFRTPQGELEFEVTVVTQTPAGDFDDRSLSFHVVRQPSPLQLWRIIRKSDAIHIAGPALPPLVLGLLARKQVVVEHHGYQAICLNGVLVYQPDGTTCPGHFQAGRYRNCLDCQQCQTSVIRSLARLLLMFPRHWLSRKVAMNIAITRQVLERHALPRSSVIYYGVEAPLGEDVGIHSAVNASGTICFAYVGRFVPEKGIPILLQAARTLKTQGHQFEVRLIGDGPERPRLDAIIGAEHLEDCVRITGYLTGAALANALSDVRVVVMPSVWEETAGLAAIEQMMRGRLVIASRIGGLSEVVGDAGLQFPPGNAEALAECMIRVMQDTSIIGSIGLKARKRALQLFPRARMVEEHATAYREIVRGESKRYELN